MTATFTKVQDAQPVGQYKSTMVDQNKKTVDFTIIQVAPFYIRWANGDTQKVSASKLAKLQMSHTFLTDF